MRRITVTINGKLKNVDDRLLIKDKSGVFIKFYNEDLTPDEVAIANEQARLEAEKIPGN